MTGQTVSHYKIGQRLGAGGMGEVFQAEDLKLGRQVALKFLPVDLAGDPQAVKRFLWEARSLSALNHPNICTIYEVDEHDGRPFIAMELVEGEELNRVVNGRALATDLILTLATQIADGLDVAHQQGLLHRDIKPANILVTRRNQAKILDFGLAKIAHDAQYPPVAGAHAIRDLTTTAGVTMGTVAYMSPEQARGEELDRRSDLFSFGLVLYEMATGRQTFTGNTTAVIFDGILNREPVPAGRLNPALPAELDRIIGKALEKDRDLRYQSASDLRADLQRLRREYASGRHVASSGAMQTLKESGTLPPVTAPVPVAAPATHAVDAIAALSSGPQAAAPRAGAPVPRPRSARSATIRIAAGVLVVVAAAGAWLAWRGLLRPSVPAGGPASTSPAPASPPAAAPATAAPTTGGDQGAAAAGPAGSGAPGQPAVTDRASASRRESDPTAEQQELASARAKFQSKQLDQAFADLKAFLTRHPASALAADASLLLGQVAAAQPGRELEAIALYGDVVARFPNSSRAPEALYYKASLQDRLKLREADRTLGVTVPASLITYRAMADRYPRAVLSQHAHFRLAGIYSDLARYDLAAQAFEKLGASFPDSSYDGWFRAGEVYERRLNDKDKARAAYLRVPPTSPRYRDAQKRAGK